MKPRRQVVDVIEGMPGHYTLTLSCGHIKRINNRRTSYAQALPAPKTATCNECQQQGALPMTEAITLPLTPTADDLAHFNTFSASAPHLQDPENEIRQRIVMERAVIRRAATDLIAAGYTLRVFYGNENGDSSDYGCLHTQHLPNVMDGIGACDEEWLNVYKPNPNQPGKLMLVGQVALVYGNDGPDVIADYHTRLEDALKGANDYGDALNDALHRSRHPFGV